MEEEATREDIEAVKRDGKKKQNEIEMEVVKEGEVKQGIGDRKEAKGKIGERCKSKK